jgi:hypothetical protein
MSVNYPQAIFDQFANNADPVRVQGVTQVDPDGAGPQPARRLTLAEMDATADPSSSSSNASAKKELLVVLLNVVSGRLSLDLVVDAQGTTLAQQIRILAALINGNTAANDRRAHDVAACINAGHAADSRLHMGLDAMTDPGTTEVTASLTVARESGSRIRFTIALMSPGPVTLDLYDVSGRHVTQVYRGDAPAGETAVSWSRGSVRPACTSPA